MRVLLTGGLNLAQSLQSAERGFRRIGCETAYQSSRNADKTKAREDIFDRLGKVVLEFRPDILYWFMCKADCPLGIIKYLKNLCPGMAAVYHSFDDPFEIDMTGSPQAAQFDAAVTCCEGSIPRYLAMGVKRAICLYPPCDLELHPKAEVKDALRCDFSFVGTNVYPQARYPHVLVERRELIYLASRIGSLQLWGHWDKSGFGWGHPTWGEPTLSASFKGWAQFAQLPDIYLSAAINIGSHVRPDGYRYLNERVIGVMAAGGFLLTDHVNGIDEIFRVGCELDTYRSLGDFEQKARWYLANPERRKAVAEAGRQKALAAFNNEAYAQAVLALAGSV